MKEVKDLEDFLVDDDGKEFPKRSKRDYSKSLSSKNEIKDFFPPEDTDDSILHLEFVRRGFFVDVLTIQIDVTFTCSGEEFALAHLEILDDVRMKLEDIRNERDGGGGGGKIEICLVKDKVTGKVIEINDSLENDSSIEIDDHLGARIESHPITTHIVTFEAELIRDKSNSLSRSMEKNTFRWRIVDIDGALGGNNFC
jgi:hypothetical protein